MLVRTLREILDVLMIPIHAAWEGAWDTSESKISKRIEKDTKYIQRAMGKNALTKLIQKMMKSGVGFGKLNTEEYADMMKDGLEEESQKAINDFNNYLEQSGFNTNFTLKKK